MSQRHYRDPFDRIGAGAAVGVLVIWLIGLIFTLAFWTGVLLIGLDAFNIIDVVGFV